MKKIIRLISFIIILFIVLTFLIAFFISNGDNLLNTFKIKNVNNVGLNYYVYYSKVMTSKKYEIIVYDSNNRVIYQDKTKNNNITIKFNSLTHDEKYKIYVYAIDSKGNKKCVRNPYTFIWDELDFSENNLVYMDNDHDYELDFIGNYKDKKYKLNIIKDNELYKTVNITKDNYVIDNKLFKDKSTEFTFEITLDSLVLSTYKAYNLTSPVTDINIKTPSDGDMLKYNDVSVSFEGGDNATNYLLELYQGETLIKRKEISEKNLILANNLFEKSASYKLKITASYMDFVNYSKTSEINFTINPKETLKAVYTNKTKLVKKGTKIKLISPDNATIYYTLDGTEPNESSTVYKNEITINEDTTIKCIAKEDNKNDSIVSTFNFKVGEKNKYKVYLSASNQNANLGVESTGYTNEKKEMNDLTNYIEKRLNEYGVTTYRNEYGDINRWTSDSTYLGVDLHLAIHSNASEEHKTYGIETWVNSESSNMYSLAEMIQQNLFSIYYSDDTTANRGVKEANGSLGEVNPLYTPVGILVEVAHHDYEKDAAWIMENKEKIGDNIADSILEYFNIK